MVYDSGKFGNHVRALRGERSQDDLAKAIGVSRETIVQLENGVRKRWPDPEIFNSLARELGVSPVQLLRIAGARIPISQSEDLDWLAEQLTEEGIALLVDLGRALLPHHRRRPERPE